MEARLQSRRSKFKRRNATAQLGTLPSSRELSKENSAATAISRTVSEDCAQTLRRQNRDHNLVRHPKRPLEEGTDDDEIRRVSWEAPLDPARHPSSSVSDKMGQDMVEDARQRQLEELPAPSLPPRHLSSSGAWTMAADNTLIAARESGKNWGQIQMTYFPNKTPNSCRKRHERLMERKSVDDWDTGKIERMAKEYMFLRKELWAPLAQRTGESWHVVEQMVRTRAQSLLYRSLSCIALLTPLTLLVHVQWAPEFASRSSRRRSCHESIEPGEKYARRGGWSLGGSRRRRPRPRLADNFCNPLKSERCGRVARHSTTRSLEDADGGIEVIG